MKQSEMLIAMGEYIAEHGWVQGKYEDDDGNVCIRGASINVADAAVSTDGREVWVTRQKALCTLANYLGYDYSMDLVGWNDTVVKSAEEVILTCKTVGYKLEEKGL